jgi:cell volume regulation protein A
VILTICLLLLLAYIFDVTSSKTKVPSVILLLALGMAVDQIAKYFNFPVPDLEPLLPNLGTVGLILIVLEGSLELELNKSKLPLIGKSSLLAILPMLALSFALAYLFQYFGDTSFKIGLANAIPFAIISSAIAIPSAQNLKPFSKEFITYESSLSDIFGVIFFNFITLNDNLGTSSLTHFGLELLLILLISLVATLALAFLLGKITHHVKFVPIILLIITIYSVSKIYHLPALIFIMLFGLSLGNLKLLKKSKYAPLLKPEILDKEVHRFKELIVEITFLVRALFFLLFGYLIKSSEIFNMDTIAWAMFITFGIFALRLLFLKLLKLKLDPLYYFAPRGLITILLFLTLPATQVMPLVNKSLIIQVIILSALIMMIGLIVTENLEDAEEQDQEVEDENEEDMSYL